MNDMFQKNILGTEASPSQWKLPVTKEADQALKIDHSCS